MMTSGVGGFNGCIIQCMLLIANKLQKYAGNRGVFTKRQGHVVNVLF